MSYLGQALMNIGRDWQTRLEKQEDREREDALYERSKMDLRELEMAKIQLAEKLKMEREAKSAEREAAKRRFGNIVSTGGGAVRMFEDQEGNVQTNVIEGTQPVRRPQIKAATFNGESGLFDLGNPMSPVKVADLPPQRTSSSSRQPAISARDKELMKLDQEFSRTPTKKEVADAKGLVSLGAVTDSVFQQYMKEREAEKAKRLEIINKYYKANPASESSPSPDPNPDTSEESALIRAAFEGKQDPQEVVDYLAAIAGKSRQIVIDGKTYVGRP